MKVPSNLVGHYNENNKFSANFFKTKDDSISIALEMNQIQSELMHSESGAFSETLYVYLPVVEFIVKNNLKPKFLSIGLVAGYIEIMLVSYLIKRAKENEKIQNLIIESFEAEVKLIEFFKSYFFDENIPSAFKNCYDKIIELNCAYFTIEKKILKAEIKKLIILNKLRFNEKYLLNTQIQNPAHGIFFDAFSVNSSPELWEEKLIWNILSIKNAAPSCSFATYASKTILKKILKENNFILQKKKGFSGKRECIYAERI